MPTRDTDLGPEPLSMEEAARFMQEYNGMMNRRAASALEEFTKAWTQSDEIREAAIDPGAPFKPELLRVVPSEPRPSVTDMCADLAEQIEDLIRETAGPDFYVQEVKLIEQIEAWWDANNAGR